MDTERTTMQAEDLVTQVTPAYGGDWIGARTALLESEADRNVIDTLRNVLQSGAQFEREVVLDPEDMAVLNGMHRIVAAWLEGASVPVRWGWPEVDDEECLEVEFTLSGVGDGDAGADFAMGWLRSFPIPGGWLETDAVASHGSRDGTVQLAAFWNWPERNVAGLEAHLRARAAEKGVELRILSAVVVDYDHPDFAEA